MKKAVTTLTFLLLLYSMGFTQSPGAFNYQAVARDALGNVIENQSISFKIRILKESIDGNAVYAETHSVTSNQQGLVDFLIGNGTVQEGDFSSIDWGSDKYFLEVSMDITGGTDYKLMGTSQLVSVPYAKYADKAGNVFSGNYSDLNNKPDITDYLQKVETATWDKDTTNEIQSLNRSGYILSISKKNNITLPDSIRMAKYAANPAYNFQLEYAQILNKPVISLSGDTIYLTYGGYVNLPDSIEYAGIAGSPASTFMLDYSKITNPPFFDSDTTNELQVLSISNDTLYLSDGNFAKLPDSTEFAEKAGSVPFIEERLDSLESILISKVNTNWLNDTSGFFIDERDKQRYNFIVIGNQVWMTENLNYGDTITTQPATDNDTIEKYAYNDTVDYLDTLGGLYTWREMMQLPDDCETNTCQDLIMTIHQGVCPTGWHIPSQTEWEELINYLGGSSVAGGKLKETGTTHWSSSSPGATNSSGFTALPGGKKTGANYAYKGEKAYFGYAVEKSEINTSTYQLLDVNDDVNFADVPKEEAFSVRCIKDE